MSEGCTGRAEPSGDGADAELDRRLAAIEAYLTTVASQLDEISASLALLAEQDSRRERRRER